MKSDRIVGSDVSVGSRPRHRGRIYRYQHPHSTRQTAADLLAKADRRQKTVIAVAVFCFIQIAASCGNLRQVEKRQAGRGPSGSVHRKALQDQLQGNPGDKIDEIKNAEKTRQEKQGTENDSLYT